MRGGTGSNMPARERHIVKVQRTETNENLFAVFGEHRAGMQYRRRSDFSDAVQRAIDDGGGVAFVYATINREGRWSLKGQVAPAQTW